MVDLEATCWEERDENPEAPAGCSYSSEIIEIGAAMLDLEAWEETGSFTTFVRPILHPELTDFCTRLTTITQAQVDLAPRFETAVRLFDEAMAIDDDVIWASWGAYDRKQLADDFRKHGLSEPDWLSRHINLKEVIIDVRGLSAKRRPSTKKLLNALNMERVGTHHRGIDDARTYAKALLAMGDAYGREKVLTSLENRLSVPEQGPGFR